MQTNVLWFKDLKVGEQFSLPESPHIVFRKKNEMWGTNIATKSPNEKGIYVPPKMACVLRIPVQLLTGLDQSQKVGHNAIVPKGIIPTSHSNSTQNEGPINETSFKHFVVRYKRPASNAESWLIARVPATLDLDLGLEQSFDGRIFRLNAAEITELAARLLATNIYELGQKYD